ncbi:MAG TPA: hypothetical protein VIM18_06100 [Solirubrobacteraceae bacterium]
MPQAGLSVRRDDWFPDEARPDEARLNDARLNDARPHETRAELREVPPPAASGAAIDVARSGVPGGGVPGGGVPGRRTVSIQGRGSERYRGVPERRRPAQRPHERAGFKPDRAAMWAVVLGVLMILAAATSSHAAMLSRHAAATNHRTATVSHSHAAYRRLGTGARLQLRPAR